MIENLFVLIGKPFVLFYTSLEKFGEFIIFQLKLIPLYFKFFKRLREVFKQMERIGVQTFWLIMLTATFTGMVEAIQLYQGFKNFGAEGFMGYTIFVSLTKELGPVFGSLMVVSRAVSSMAAELGTMRVTEQIDALDVLSIDSREYLIIPKVIATTLSLPILVAIFDGVGNLSAYFVSVYALDINPIMYQNTIIKYIHFSDIFSGIVKAFVFGFLISAIGTYIGYFASKGARGVGLATTKAVVYASIVIFGANYFLSSIFLFMGW